MLPRLPVESPPSELFITQLDRVLSNLFQFICFEKGCWKISPSEVFSNLNYSTILHSKGLIRKIITLKVHSQLLGYFSNSYTHNTAETLFNLEYIFCSDMFILRNSDRELF